MKLSIIMPVYNAGCYLEEAVESISSQTWNGEKEIIIVDDQSEDHSFTTAQRLGDRVISVKHGGAAKARNVGLKMACGDYILFLDADDVLSQDALENLFTAMEDDSNCEVVYGKAKDFVSQELSSEQRMKLKARENGYGGVLPGCALIKKTVFDWNGYFDENLSSGETVDWMMNLKETGAVVREINQVTLRRRLHMTNTGRLKREEEMKNYAAILRKRMSKE
ncbi:glycosyltransferase family A protein [Paenibacillus sinopodophylli]|uniref:glycosyltransferase family A protein n=1 Tax=Paenibacillus sinopodophylli TaxID=1837342 RepID=UPI00110D0DC6|nr:glycosyltransferase family A protein [Paenibacillus sinopodophylli]